MNQGSLIIVFIAIIISVLAIFAAIQFKKLAAIRKKHPGYPKGYWMNQGIGIGIAIGAGIGAAMGKLSIGIALGLAIGVAIGSGLEKKHKGEIRPQTDEEKQVQKQSILFMTAALITGMLVFIIFYFIVK